jgi:hypothetical protein
MERYEIDTLVNLQATFTLADGVTPADPTTVTVYVRNPAGTLLTYTYAAGDVTRTSAGSYAYSLYCAASGKWSYKWQGAGAIEVTSPDTAFQVNRSTLIPG